LGRRGASATARPEVLAGPRNGDGLAAARVRVPQTAGGWAVALVFVLLTGRGVLHLIELISRLQGRQWLTLLGALALTFLRTSMALAIGAAWTVPAGILIGRSPRLSRACQPVIQVLAGFPAPMLFPLVIGALLRIGVGFAWGCVALMLLGAQWYILFNVLAGAMAIPQDLQEAAEVYGVHGWRR